MQFVRNLFSAALLLVSLASTLGSCKTQAPVPSVPGSPTTPGNPSLPNTPVTTIPDEFVGTWFVKDNLTPLTLNWDQGTVKGELGFRDFRTMVFTKNGQNAVEYSTFTVDLGNGQVRRRFYKFTGTLEYKGSASPRSLTFHAQSGVMRVYNPGAATPQESPILASDVAAYHTVWESPVATSFTTSTNYLTCQRLDGSAPVSAQYEKVNPNAPAEPEQASATPFATGTFVKAGNLYYRTVVIGDLEWTTMNYAGTGGITDPDKPYYGTFVNRPDLGSVPVPAGWRIPTRQDFEKLLATRNVQLEPWNATPDDMPTTQALGPLQSTVKWRRVDSWATNATGFNALPANIRVISQFASPNGEGSNFLAWTSDYDASGQPLAFKIIQNTLTTYASINAMPTSSTSTAPHIPVRFVRNK